MRKRQTYHVTRKKQRGEYHEYYVTLENRSFKNDQRAYMEFWMLLGMSVAEVAELGELTIKTIDGDSSTEHRVSTPEAEDLFVIKIWRE